MPSAAAIAAYALGSTPWSCTRRAPKTDSTMAMTRKPNRSRSWGEPRRVPLALAGEREMVRRI